MTDATNEVHPRSILDQVPAYKAGKPAAAREGLTTYKISSNENPYPPLPSVLTAVQAAVGRMNRYPDAGVTALGQALAAKLQVTPEEIVTGTGSVAVLGYLLQAMCDAGDQVVYAWRSFEAYPIVVAINGAESIQVPLDEDARHDLTAMRAAITDRTKVVLVCTPNNPTGPSVTDSELRSFLESVPAHVLVVIDEAYLEFGTSADAPDAMSIYRAYPNVCVLRTFSKAYGLAGLRVGYVVAHPELAAGLRKVATPFGVSDVAQAAAVASLEAFEELQQRVDSLVAERTRVLRALREQGWKVPDSEANFVWLPTGADTAAFAEAAETEGIVVRAFHPEGVRCTIAETEANDRLIKVAEAFRAAQAG